MVSKVKNQKIILSLSARTPPPNLMRWQIWWWMNRACALQKYKHIIKDIRTRNGSEQLKLLSLATRRGSLKL